MHYLGEALVALIFASSGLVGVAQITDYRGWRTKRASRYEPESYDQKWANRSLLIVGWVFAVLSLYGVIGMIYVIVRDLIISLH